MIQQSEEFIKGLEAARLICKKVADANRKKCCNPMLCAADLCSLALYMAIDNGVDSVLAHFLTESEI